MINRYTKLNNHNYSKRSLLPPLYRSFTSDVVRLEKIPVHTLRTGSSVNMRYLAERIILTIHIRYSPSLFVQVGWILAKFFFAFLWTETRNEVEVHKNAKKE